MTGKRRRVLAALLVAAALATAPAALACALSCGARGGCAAASSDSVCPAHAAATGRASAVHSGRRICGLIEASSPACSPLRAAARAMLAAAMADGIVFTVAGERAIAVSSIARGARASPLATPLRA